ncbi:MAG: hypothetical protein H0V17_33035 [Deltaproteobacteria bacterium]|nr:hypothetical protein [Deltaproteobacteria bacterium]
MRYLATLLVLVAGAGSAWAEKAKAKEGAIVYNRAGERGQVVLKVKEGQVMRIDRKEGRWYKVRVSGRTGWIPRSKVEILEEEEMVRNTRRRPFVDGRSTKRGFGGETGPDDRVGADAVDTGGDDDKGKPPPKGGGDDDDSEDDDTDKPKPGAKPKPGTKPKPTTKPPKGEDSEDDTEESDSEDDGNTDGEEPKVSDDEGAEVTNDRPTAKVKKKVAVYSEADAESEESFTASPAMVLYPTGKKKGSYVEVETEDGDIGFVLASAIEVSEPEDSGPKGGPKTRQIDARARIGVTIIQQVQSTPGSVNEDRPDNYKLSTSAITIALGGAYLRPYKASYLVGGELAVDMAKAVPGIKVDAMNTTGITVYNVNARAMFGKDFKRKSGMLAFGRLGFRYYSYQVSDVGDLTKNTAKLPSEIVKAPTLGGALAIPRLTEKIGLRFSLDAVLLGASMQQTKGLEDGDAKKAKGAIAGIGFTYRWKPAMDINATYDLNYMKYDFGTPSTTSMRGHDAAGTSTGRTDVFHAVTVGVAKAF